MSWTRYAPGPRSRSDVPKMTLWRGGQIAFNNPAVKRFNLEDFSHCVLYYDKEQKKIGIKPTKKEDEIGLVKLKKYKWGYLIWARNFIKTSGLVLGKTNSLHPMWDEKDKMIVASFG